MSDECSKQFLQTFLDRIEQQTITRNERILLLHFMMKHQLLLQRENQGTIQEENINDNDDVWDWISLGMFLKTSYLSTKSTKCVEE
jgi:hypothetical protein